MHRTLCSHSFAARRGALGRRLATPLRAAGLALALLAAPPAAATPAPRSSEAPPAAAAETAPILPLDQVVPGLTGYGLSVFRGDRLERFDVEVLGVWRNVRPGTSYILARLGGQGLETSGVIAGMSGSPVYLDGRLAGAVAFAWPFAQEAIAGITPIEAMRQLRGVPSPAAPPRAAADSGWLPDLKALAAADLPADLLAERLARLRPGVSDLAAGAPGHGLQWSTVGFAPRTRELLEKSLGGLTAAGDATAGAAARAADLVPGAAVAGVLVDGDLRMAATGTVTDRSGDEILAFGHPFLGFGPLRLPMAGSEIVTVLSSRYSSFKIANLGPVVGALDLDRMAGVRGRLGLAAPTTPVEVAVEGEERRSFALAVADLPPITPTLMAISVLASVDAATQAAGNQGLDLTARFDLGERGALEVRQSFDGEGAVTNAAVYVLAFAGFILQNRMEQVDIAALDVEVRQFGEPRTARLISAHAGRTVVRPGEKVPLNLDLVAFRGDHFRRSVELEVPTGLPDGRYSLLVGDGVSADVARLAIERTDPVNFDQALAFLRALHSRREVVILGLFRGPGLAVAGEVLPQLPDSLRSIWGAAGSSSAVPLPLAIADQRVLELDVPVEGILRVDLEVRRQGPLSPDEDGEGGAAAGEGGAGGAAADGGAAAETAAEAKPDESKPEQGKPGKEGDAT